MTKAKWLCDCGKETDQGDRGIIEKCVCGKVLYQLKEPDGLITEFHKADDWFIKEFDEQDKKMAQTDMKFRQNAYKFFKGLKTMFEIVDEIDQGQKKMQNTVEQGARRTKDHTGRGLMKRQDMMWNFNRAVGRFMGRKKATPTDQARNILGKKKGDV